MPTYDYECPKGHTFEAFQKMTDEPVSACPECGAPARRKISGGAGFLFKGEGFYITESRSDDYKKKASAEAGGAPAKSAKEGDKGGSDSTTSEKGGGASSESKGAKSSTDS